VLFLYCHVYIAFKLSIVHWLPIVKPDSSEDHPVRRLKKWTEAYDSGRLAFLEGIKPAAQNRGIISYIGNAGDVFVRDVVISDKDAKWLEFENTKAYTIVAAYRSGSETDTHPFLSILHLGGLEDYENIDQEKYSRVRRDSIEILNGDRRARAACESARRHPISRKTRAYDSDGSWPLHPPLKWDRLAPIKEEEWTYDIWAMPEKSKGEIDVYTATGEDIRQYLEKGGSEHIKLIRPYTAAKAQAVRAVRLQALPR